MLYSSVLIFLLGSALCGAAQNLLWLIVCRGVQGIGGGGILQIVQSTSTQLFSVLATPPNPQPLRTRNSPPFSQLLRTRNPSPCSQILSVLATNFALRSHNFRHRPAGRPRKVLWRNRCDLGTRQRPRTINRWISDRTSDLALDLLHQSPYRWTRSRPHFLQSPAQSAPWVDLDDVLQDVRLRWIISPRRRNRVSSRWFRARRIAMERCVHNHLVSTLTNSSVVGCCQRLFFRFLRLLEIRY